MHDYKLKTSTALMGHQTEINGVKISEILNFQIYALAFAVQNEKKVAAIIKKRFNCNMPIAGKATISKSKKNRIIRLSTDQLFLLVTTNEKELIMDKLKRPTDPFYLTEQTDAWTGVSISGVRVYECLERICPVNLTEKMFPNNSFARTSMEHLNVIIIKTRTNQFDLYSSSSSAVSFLHMIETSAKNI